MSTSRRFRPVVLCVLDGWGHRAEARDNAIAQARTPVWDRLMASAAHGLIEASNADVGLPDGQMGNSEVGHMNLGAGRIVTQDLLRIDAAVADGSLAANPALGGLIDALADSGGTCHLLGLMSRGGVHSHQSHIAALARILRARGIPVAVHAFLDGRDTAPSSARDCVRDFEAAVPDAPIATVSGRYHAMDRDNRWDRVAAAYAALADAEGARAADADGAIAAAYARGETDEFVRPTVIGEYAGMSDGDGVLMANFRPDRARQILTALLDPAFDRFPRRAAVRFAAACGMTAYSAELNAFLSALFPPERTSGILGEVVADAGLRQLRVAETEKYAHVTYFLDAGREAPFAGEERILVPSPKIATYDLKPEMSAFEVTDRVVEAVEGGGFDLIVVNYANADMVGHTGILEAAVRAVEAVDACLGRVVAAVTAAGGALVVTADHGNAETMRDPVTREPHTAHTSNPVPFVVVGPAPAEVTVRGGRLADVAPSVLELMGLPKPAAMTGRSLLAPAARNRRAGAR